VLGHLSSSSDLNQFPVDEVGDGHLHEADFHPEFPPLQGTLTIN
jgi:hypothetical protein